MNWFLTLFNEIFYRPLLNALVWLTDILPFNDLGLAVIILTILVRTALFPVMHRATKTQHKMKQIEPELKKIKENSKNREEQARQIMELYRAHGVNPFSSIVLLFIQLPILIALYLVFREAPHANAEYFYSFVSAPEKINALFLGIFDLNQGNVILAVFAGLSQFIQLRLARPPSDPAEQSAKAKTPDFAKMFSLQMNYFMPVLIFFIAARFPSAVALYWTTLNIFAIVHEGFVRKKAKKIYATGNDKENSNTDSRPSSKNGL